MDRKKKTAIIYYIAAALCYLCAIVWFCGSGRGLGVLWLCIGSANLCLGSVWMKRSREAAVPENAKENRPDGDDLPKSEE